MDKSLYKILFLIVPFSALIVFDSRSFFSDALARPSLFSLSCWTKPTVPELQNPENNFLIGLDSPWLDEKKFSWITSISECSLDENIQYNFEIYRDAELSSLYETATNLSPTEYTTTSLPSGDYWWRVNACADYSGCSDWSYVWRLSIDTKAPVAEIIYPQEGDTLLGDIEIKVSIQEDHEFSYKLIIINDEGAVASEMWMASKGFSDKTIFNWPTEDYENGDYSIKVEAEDIYGNHDEKSEDSVDVRVLNYKKRSVVINEIMWMGTSGHERDEWIELKNTTDSDIDLDGWKINSAGPDSHSISMNKKIPSEGYLIIAVYPSDYEKENKRCALNDSLMESVEYQVEDGMHLLDKGEKLELISPSDYVVDETPDIAGNNKNGDKGWAAGDVSKNDEGDLEWHSMERTDTDESGDNESNWRTCKTEVCRSKDFWDSDSNYDWGTPGKANSDPDD